MGNLRWCAMHEVHAVVGTTGLGDAELDELRHLFTASNCIVAPNFAIGAVLMMRFAELAAPFFETAEIIELHHDQKVDAPSGTAMMTARAHGRRVVGLGGRPDRRSRSRPARGAGSAPATSTCTRCGCAGSSRIRRCCSARPVSRSPIRHDSYDRSSFMPGVLLAVKAVADRPGLTIGLDAVLGVARRAAQCAAVTRCVSRSRRA